MTKTMSTWLGYKFSTGSFPGEDYLKFQRNARASLKKMAEENGFELFNFSKNHYCFSAVLRKRTQITSSMYRFQTSEPGRMSGLIRS